MIDCGIAQGRDTVLPMDRWPVPASEIHFLFLTHAHIDHIGRIPELIRGGFKGEIICTHGTKALLGPMLRDAMSLTGFSREDAGGLNELIDDLSWGFEYDEVFDLRRGVRFKLYRAGHILGSCIIRFEADRPDWSVVFSGDLGAADTPILPDPEIPDPCDLLVLESTYGDRLHDDRSQRIDRLSRILETALSDGGKVLIPAFALGRTQELIYEMDRIISGRFLPPPPFPVLLDSPLGIEITKIYSTLSEFWDQEARDLVSAGDHPIDFDGLYAVRDHRDHLKLVQEADGPCVIIAGSGMCTAGRIVNHLKTSLPDPRNDVLFVGYQAPGTPGREISSWNGKGDAMVMLDGERIPLKARVHVLSGYSAHADQRGLLQWVAAISEKPKEIRLVHGEPGPREALARLLAAAGYALRGVRR
jgi:metallo-beta-lactamase family protein